MQSSCKIYFHLNNYRVKAGVMILDCKDVHIVSHILHLEGVQYKVDGHNIMINESSKYQCIGFLHRINRKYKAMLQVAEEIGQGLHVIVTEKRVSFNAKPGDELYNRAMALLCTKTGKVTNAHPIVKSVIGIHHESIHKMVLLDIEVYSQGRTIVKQIRPLSWMSTVGIRLTAARMKEQLQQKRIDCENISLLEQHLPEDILNEIRTYIINV